MTERGSSSIMIAIVLGLAACASPQGGAPSAALANLATALDSTQRIAAPTGFAGPESVRYDAEQDVYFVGNWNGAAGASDNNGFISRMSPDGVVQNLRFIAGGQNGVTLHAPRGMFVTGDTLWAADVDAVRGFHRRTGAPVATVDFTGRDVNFLNDLAAGPDGVLYVTDTGRNRIYRIAGRDISVALEDTLLSRPNGITWDAANQRFVIVPFGGSRTVFAWQPGQRAPQPIGTIGATQMDGVEVLNGGAIVIGAQSDGSLHALVNGVHRTIARTGGRPADIAVDTRRNRVAVPFVALNQVEIWQLPR